MTPPPRIHVPSTCTSVTPQCPVEGTLYGYAPSIPANAFFASFFGLVLVCQLYLSVRYKTWTYLIAVGLGCLAECVGYVGRVMMGRNAFDDGAFKVQIVLLIFAPAFLAAGIYLTLKHIVIQFGEEWSRLRPSWYTYIFIICDFLSLALQSAGGALAAIADPGESIGDIGTDLMIAGIIWQVVVLVIFALIIAEYAYRTYQHRSRLSPSATSLWSDNRRFKLFCAATGVAYITILIRCVYRIPELTGGWGGPLMRIESEYIVLESVMIMITVLALTMCHPGVCFSALANTIGRKRGEERMEEMVGAEARI